MGWAGARSHHFNNNNNNNDDDDDDDDNAVLGTLKKEPDIKTRNTQS